MLRNIYMIMLLFTLFLMLYMLHSLLIFIHTCLLRWWRYVLHDLRPKIIISLGSMGSRTCPLVCACPLVPTVVMVTLSVSPPSGVFLATTFLQEILLFPSTSHALPMMTSLSLPLSAVLGRVRIFFHWSRSHSLGRAPCPPEISIVPR
jgi:hypothetical protein